MAVNAGERVAAAWEAYVTQCPATKWETAWFTLPAKPRKPLSARQQARLEAQWKRADDAYRAEKALAYAKFVGAVVSVDDADGDPVLVYADGRRVLVRESEWLA